MSISLGQGSAIEIANPPNSSKSFSNRISIALLKLHMQFYRFGSLAHKFRQSGQIKPGYRSSDLRFNHLLQCGS